MSTRRTSQRLACEGVEASSAIVGTTDARPSMQVALAFVAQRVNVWLRFGQPLRETVVDRWRRSAEFAPDATCCRVKWIGNDFGTALWQLMILQAPTAQARGQRVSGVTPGARILLRASGHGQVNAVLQLIDGIEGLPIDPCTVAPSYWCTVGNRLAARLAPPAYTHARHAAHLAREALR